MNVLYAWNKLLVKFACLLFLQSLVCHYIIKELSGWAELHDKIQLTLSLNDLQIKQILTYFIKLDDVWMSDLLEYFNFTSDSFDIFLIFNFVLLQDFHGNLIIYSKSLYTFSPVKVCVACLTLPKVPLPKDFPKNIELAPIQMNVLFETYQMRIVR